MAAAMEEARLHFGAGRTAEAEAACREIIARQPGNAEALQILGMLAYRDGDTPRAIEWLSRAAEASPGEPAFLCNLALVQIEGGALEEALGSCRAALRLDPALAQAHNNLGDALMKLGRGDEAADGFREAIRLNPDYPEAHNNLGNALKELGRFEEAVQSLRTAAKVSPGVAEIHTNLGIALKELGRFEEAGASCREALRLNPAYFEAHNNLGSVLKEQGELDGALASYQKAIELQPASADAHYNSGTVLQNMDRLDEALGRYEKTIELQPDHAMAYFCRGLIFYRQKRFPEAEENYRLAIRHKPDYLEARIRLAGVYREIGKFEAAAEILGELLRLDPSNSEVHNNLGLTLKGSGSFSESVSSFQEALRLDPEFVEAYCNLGSVLAAAGRKGEAVIQYEKALAIRPDFFAALIDLGNIARERKQFERAIECFGRVTELIPDDDAPFLSLGLTYTEMGRTEKAEEAYRRAQLIRPTDGTRVRLSMLLPAIYSSREDMESRRRKLEANVDELLRDGVDISDPMAEVSTTNFYLAYQGFDDRSIQEKIARVYRTIGDFPDLVPNSGSRLRVGFISTFFKEHTIGKLMRGFVENFSRDRFEVVVLSPDHPGDPVSEEFKRYADEFRILPQDFSAAREIVRESGLDILFYSDIGMDPLTYFLSFSRLAPVQCVAWGHPVTTGSGTIDYFISSEDLEPEGAEAFYTEKLVRMSRLPAYYYRPEPPLPLRPRTDFGFSESEHIYFCPQSLFKLHPDFDESLGEILRADPAGRIVLIDGFTPEWNDLLIARFRASIPDAVDRIRFISRQSERDYLNLLSIADVVLDPFYFSGGSTSQECFSFGTPIVTLPGRFMRGRVTYACYKKMGVDDCIAASPGEYVEIAAGLGMNPDRRAAVREKILGACHVLYEDIEVVRELERFFEEAAGKKGDGASGVEGR